VAGGLIKDCVGVADERPEVVESLLLHPPLKMPCLPTPFSDSIVELVFDSIDKLNFRLSLNAGIDRWFGL
jgi:hypothetical protein